MSMGTSWLLYTNISRDAPRNLLGSKPAASLKYCYGLFEFKQAFFCCNVDFEVHPDCVISNVPVVCRHDIRAAARPPIWHLVQKFE